MKESTSVALSISVVALAIGAVLTALIYFGMTSLSTAHENGTERLQSCIDSGGTYLYGGCLK